LSTEALKKLALASKKLEILEERERQTGPGGLMAFVRYFWTILEPNQPFVRGWAIDAIAEHLEAVHFGQINRLLINVPPGFSKSLLTNCFFPAWEWSAMNRADHRYLSFSYAAHLTRRDNRKLINLLKDQRFAELWGRHRNFELVKEGEELVGNSKTGWKFATSVGGVGTGERGSRILLDDPHNVKDTESDIIRNGVVRWFRESMSNRLNNETDAIVIIMQRVHSDDVAGNIIADDEGLGYTQLRVPMEYIENDPCSRPTKIGWEDPRTNPGELAWPERYTPGALRQFKILDYMWCTPKESPILMGDFSMKTISQVRTGDEIIGFTMGTAGVDGKSCSRRKLVKTKVVAIHRSVQPVVKITLDSGKVVRCTPDHRWYTGFQGQEKRKYRPARVGHKLMRVCEAEDPQLTIEQAHDAGWLAGFFDGEGSVVLNKRSNGNRTSGCISFSQSNSKNKHICDKLEKVLTNLDFKFGFKQRIPKQANWAPTRWYYIVKRGVDESRRFLHIVRPEKWRDRLVAGALGANFIRAKEEVISIEADGEEEVFGLQTETGNYIVWGLCSSNSAQYQQDPVPRGGAIILKDWWRLWENPESKQCTICNSFDIKKIKSDDPASRWHQCNECGKHFLARPERFPVCSYVLASLDTSYTESERNDPSAMTVWGIFQHPKTKEPGIVLMEAWRKWLRMNSEPMPRINDENQFDFNERSKPKWGLVEWTVHTCRRFKVDCLLIESRASGITLQQELALQYGREMWSTILKQPEGDKEARAHSVVGIFANGLVWAPDRDFASLAIEEVSQFPFGKFRDITDSTTQALRHIRNLGLVQFEEERLAEEAEQTRSQPRLQPLYPV
jgi:predicted phage terminase large subunit-like protein